MTTTITTPDALQMLSDIFEMPVLDAHTSRTAIAAWDSMGALSLMAELDERFQIELTADASRSMNSIADVLALLSLHRVLSDA
jgi:acyl carrier protein